MIFEPKRTHSFSAEESNDLHLRWKSDELSANVRNLISALVVHTAGSALKVDLTGRLAELIGADAFPACLPVPGSLVAGEGLEPPTSGL